MVTLVGVWRRQATAIAGTPAASTGGCRRHSVLSVQSVSACAETRHGSSGGRGTQRGVPNGARTNSGGLRMCVARDAPPRPACGSPCVSGGRTREVPSGTIAARHIWGRFLRFGQRCRHPVRFCRTKEKGWRSMPGVQGGAELGRTLAGVNRRTCRPNSPGVRFCSAGISREEPQKSVWRRCASRAGVAGRGLLAGEGFGSSEARRLKPP